MERRLAGELWGRGAGRSEMQLNGLHTHVFAPVVQTDAGLCCVEIPSEITALTFGARPFIPESRLYELLNQRRIILSITIGSGPSQATVALGLHG